MARLLDGRWFVHLDSLRLFARFERRRFGVRGPH